MADFTAPIRPPKPEKPKGEAAAAPTSTAEAGAAPEAGRPPVKTVAEIVSADAGDESLRKYKESLLGAAAKGDLGDVSDPRRVAVTEFRVMFEASEGQEDLVFNTDTEAGLEVLRTSGLALKEGCKYKFRISFRVQHEIVSGLTFRNHVRRAVFSNTDEIVLGSYPPSSTSHVFEYPKWDYIEAPSGMMFRGNYTAKNQFFDKDGQTHAEYDYPLHIKKTWTN